MLAGSNVPVLLETVRLLGTHDGLHEVATLDGGTLTLVADRFLDGRHFDPSDPDTYIRA